MLDYDTMAGGDKFGNVFICRVPADLNEDMEDNPMGTLVNRTGVFGAPYKLQTLINFHVGEILTSITKAALVVGGTEALVYTTVMGALGALVPFTSREDIDFFSHLEMHMRTELPPLCGRDHLAYRSFYFPCKVQRPTFFSLAFLVRLLIWVDVGRDRRGSVRAVLAAAGGQAAGDRGGAGPHAERGAEEARGHPQRPPVISPVPKFRASRGNKINCCTILFLLSCGDGRTKWQRISTSQRGGGKEGGGWQGRSGGRIAGRRGRRQGQGAVGGQLRGVGRGGGRAVGGLGGGTAPRRGGGAAAHPPVQAADRWRCLHHRLTQSRCQVCTRRPPPLAPARSPGPPHPSRPGTRSFLFNRLCFSWCDLY
jgi:hypothetical protein